MEDLEDRTKERCHGKIKSQVIYTAEAICVAAANRCGLDKVTEENPQGARFTWQQV